MRIRRADLIDAKGLAACIDAAYAPARARGIDLPPVSEGVDQDIRDHLVWVTEDCDIRGGIVVAMHGNRAHLVNIAVHPASGGQGIGKQLIETALGVAQDRGALWMDLATHVDMPENVVLYGHLGWQETGREANKVLMTRRLK